MLQHTSGRGRRNAPRPRPPGRVLNPLRTEDEAFRFLLYAIAVIAAIVALILVLRAIF